MRSRTLHALAACVTFLIVALCYGFATGTQVELFRVALWSIAGIASYIALSHVFGFDPHRTRLTHFAAEWAHYVDRWELRLGQATLSMLGCMILAARVLDQANFVLAVVSGTLSAWTYFAWRLYAGGYDTRARNVR